VLGVEELTILSGIGATATEVIGLRSLRDRRKIQDVETALLLQVADEIVLMGAPRCTGRFADGRVRRVAPAEMAGISEPGRTRAACRAL
jgi:hypothetical protein